MQTCRNRVRNVKTFLDLNPVGDMMGNKMVSAGTSVEKNKNRANVFLLLKCAEYCVEKDEVPSVFALVFTVKTGFQQL